MAGRAARPPGDLPHRGQRPARRPDPRDGELLAPLGAGCAAARRRLHGDRPRSDRSRRLGHARGDYSLGAHAASIRDLLAAIGVDRATIVGHSLGGGVAMQFFYQFPQRTERLALVSSGGLGHEVSPLLRSAALPGASPLLSLAAHPRAAGRAHGIAVSGCSGGLRQGRLPAGDRTRPAAARGARRPRGLPADAALRDRRPRSAGQRARPPLSAELHADADRVGRAGQHDPAGARARSARSGPGSRFETLPEPPTSPISKTRRASPRCCATSSRRPSRRASTMPIGAAWSAVIHRAAAGCAGLLSGDVLGTATAVVCDPLGRGRRTSGARLGLAPRRGTGHRPECRGAAPSVGRAWPAPS